MFQQGAASSFFSKSFSTKETFRIEKLIEKEDLASPWESVDAFLELLCIIKSFRTLRWY